MDATVDIKLPASNNLKNVGRDRQEQFSLNAMYIIKLKSAVVSLYSKEIKKIWILRNWRCVGRSISIFSQANFALCFFFLFQEIHYTHNKDTHFKRTMSATIGRIF